MAGGMGLVAASDLVFAHSNATFSLSEVLWGLLPAMVMPFLIRRVGYQNAYRLTLTASTINADEARAMYLADEVGEDIESRLQAMTRRLGRVQVETVKDLKNYFRKMWIIDEAMEKTAIVRPNTVRWWPGVRSYFTASMSLWMTLSSCMGRRRFR